MAHKGSHQTSLSRWSYPEVSHLFLDLICNCWISWAIQGQPKTSQMLLCCIPQQCSIFHGYWKGHSQPPTCKTQPLGAGLESNLYGNKSIWPEIVLCEAKQQALDHLHMLKLSPFISKTWCPCLDCLLETILGICYLLSCAWVSSGQYCLAWAKTRQEALLTVKAEQMTGDHCQCLCVGPVLFTCVGVA